MANVHVHHVWFMNFEVMMENTSASLLPSFWIPVAWVSSGVELVINIRLASQ